MRAPPVGNSHRSESEIRRTRYTLKDVFIATSSHSLTQRGGPISLFEPPPPHPTQDGFSPMHFAATQGHPKCARALFDAGAKIEGALAFMVEKDDFADLVFDMVKRDRNVPHTSMDVHGRPAISIAIGKCKQRMLQALFMLGRYEVLDKTHHTATCVVVLARDHGGGQRRASEVRFKTDAPPRSMGAGAGFTRGLRGRGRR